MPSGSPPRAAVVQLHNNKAADDVTLARRTYGKHVPLEQGRKPVLEVRVKREMDGGWTGTNYTWRTPRPLILWKREHLEPTPLKTLG